MATFATNLLRRWAPRFVILSGIGGGLTDETQLGDVVFSEQVRFAWHKEKPGSEIASPRPMAMDPPSLVLRAVASSAAQTAWQSVRQKKPPKKLSRKNEAISGEIASGQDILSGQSKRDSPLVRQVLADFPRALVVETESGGLARAIYDSQAHGAKFDYLVVRGISDQVRALQPEGAAVDNNATRGLWKSYAAESAAAFALTVVRACIDSMEEDPALTSYRARLSGELVAAGGPGTLDYPLSCLGSGYGVIDPEALGRRLRRINRGVLCGAAGSGKSRILTRMALASASTPKSDTIPVVLWLGDYEFDSKDWAKAFKTAGPESAMALLFAIAPGLPSVERIKSWSAKRRVLFLIDGLNEIPAGPLTGTTVGSLIDRLVQFADSLGTRTCILATDRPTDRGLTGWEQYRMRLLPTGFVRAAIKRALSEDGYDSLNSKTREMLRIPYYLNRAIGFKTTSLPSDAESPASFFTDQLRISGSDLDRLAKFSYDAYCEYQLRPFDIDKLKAAISDRVFKALIESRIVRTIPRSDGQLAVFSHQLEREYLASRHIARHGNLWAPKAFDAVTLQLNSLEPLPMAIQQLNDPPSVDAFLHAVYDWSWGAAMVCLARAAGRKPHPFSPELETAILCLVAEKANDRMMWTRARTLRILKHYPRDGRGTVERVLDEPKMQNLANLVASIDAESGWFHEWRALFTVGDSATTRAATLNQLESGDSIIGWTASNVLRRSSLGPDDTRELRSRYKKHERIATREAGAVRWRVVHTLGAVATRASADLLMSALDKDVYDWTRYGAARSLIEIAATSEDPKLQAGIVSSLVGRLRRGSRARAGPLSDPILDELWRSMFCSPHSDGWVKSGVRLLRAVEAASELPGRKRDWSRRLMKFKEWGN